MNPATVIAIGCGLASSLLFLAVLAGQSFIFLQYVTQLPLMIAGLGFGLTPAMMAIGVAIGVALLFDPRLALFFAVGHAIPVALLVRFALLNRPAPEPQAGVEWYPAGRLLAVLTVYAVLTLAVMGLIASGVEGGLAGQIGETVRDFVDQIGRDKLPAELEDAILRLAYILPAMFVMSAILVTIVNGLLAQNLLKSQQRNLRASPRYIDLDLPDWLLIGLGAAIAIWWLGDGEGVGFIAAAMAVVLAMPFFFQGLAVVHCLARRSGSPTVVLVVFYIALMLIIWLTLLVTVVGVVEQRARWRAKLLAA